MPPRRASHLPPAQPIHARRLCNGAALLLHWFLTLTGYKPSKGCLPLGSNVQLSTSGSGRREHTNITLLVQGSCKLDHSATRTIIIDNKIFIRALIIQKKK